ncbi:hypothetical protein PR048_008591 [Dryococelus australis]|uniref:DUF659 domain-containing protein n=1 Tax=Dryococelus australis TaxID=614101 RepID=A0ABQ9HXJ3_9NEOP|nr:hypothetical protein PR048_008591 [Dryococelus australis]
MHEHLRKVPDMETYIHYPGKDIQNNAVEEKILSAISGAKSISIVLDCTSNVSHVELMTIIVRFVATIGAKGCEMKEHFLGFVLFRIPLVLD